MVTSEQAKQAAIDCFEGIDAQDLERAIRPFTEDTVFEFVGALNTTLVGRDAIADNFTGWWKAYPRIQNGIIGITVDEDDGASARTVAIEWDQKSTDTDGTTWRRRGVTMFVVTDQGAVEVRDYLSDVFDPRPASAG